MAKDDSKQRFLAAGHALLAAGKELGVNSVARQAGLNKVLLYRYFTDWDGFVAELATGLNLWQPIRIELTEGLAVDRWADPVAAATWVFDAYQERLRADSGVLTIMANEQARSSPLLRRLDVERETEGTIILQSILGKWPTISRERAILLSALLSAGISHLTLRARQVQFFNGLDLAKAETWSALLAEIREILVRLIA